MQDDTLYDKVTLPYTDNAPKGGDTPFFLVILLLIFFPPAAWYIMWKEEEYHHWFAWLIGIYGLLTIIGVFIIQLVLIPWSNQIYASVNLTQPEISPFAYTNIYFILGVLELGLAATLYMIKKHHRVLPTLWLVIAVTGLAFVSLIQPITIAYLTYSGFNNLVEQSKTVSEPPITPVPSDIPPSS